MLITWQTNHRLDSHLLKPSPAVCREVMWLREEGGKLRWDHLQSGFTFTLQPAPTPELSWAELRPHAAALANIWWTPTSGFFLTLAVGIHFTHPAASCWTDTWHWTLISVDMFGPGQLVSTLLPTVFHSPVAQFFPAFPTRLASQPQILIPGPFITYESLRNYLQPDPCKEALLVATQAVGMGSLAEVIGRAKCFLKHALLEPFRSPGDGTPVAQWQRALMAEEKFRIRHQLVANNQLPGCVNLGLMVAALIA